MSHKGLIKNNVNPASDSIPGGVHIQGFVADPGKCLGPIAANSILKVGAGGTVDITDWLAIAFYPTADGVVTYNGNASQTEPIYANQRNVILVHPNITQIVPSVLTVVCGM